MEVLCVFLINVLLMGMAVGHAIFMDYKEGGLIAHLANMSRWQVCELVAALLVVLLGLAGQLFYFQRRHRKDELPQQQAALTHLRSLINEYTSLAFDLPPTSDERRIAKAAAAWAVSVGNHVQARLVRSARSLEAPLSYQGPDFSNANHFVQGQVMP